MNTVFFRHMIVLSISFQLPFAAWSSEKTQEDRTAAIKKIVERHVLYSGVDLEKIHQEVSQIVPLDPVKTPEYQALIEKRDMTVKKKFPLSDQQLRKTFQLQAESLHPLYKIGDHISITYLLHGKPFTVRGKYYRETGNIFYIGSAKIAKYTIPPVIAPRFNAEQTRHLREKYIADQLKSYQQKRKIFADSLFEKEIRNSQGYLLYNRKWFSAKEFIKNELMCIAGEKGITLEQLIKGTPKDITDDFPLPSVKFDSTSSILIKYPAEAPNKFYKIPASVKVIGKSAFENSKQLERIQLPSGISSIGDSAFKGCENLSTINLPDSISRIGKEAFADCKKLKSVILPKKIETIPLGCFFASGLETIILPDSVLSIEEFSFANSKLKNIIIPASVKTIGDCAFGSRGTTIKSENPVFRTDSYGVLFDRRKGKILFAPRNIVRYIIPSNIREIGGFAFGNSELEQIHIPEQVKSIDQSAFVNCRKLNKITFAPGIMTIGSNAFSGSGLKKVFLPNTIETIGSSAFSYCADLEEISFPEKVTSLEWAVCANCDQLKKVSVSSRLRQIKGRAFWECKKLTEINIPRAVLSIEKGAFNGAPIAEKVEKIAIETFKIPGLYVTFNWNFTLDDYRSQGFLARYVGMAGKIQEYRLTDGVVSIGCFIETDKATPFCFVISGLWAKKIFTEDIMKVLKDPDKKQNFIRTKVFDAEDFDKGRSNYMAVVLSSVSFKILIHTDRNGNAQLVIYHTNDDRDEIYYQMLHYKD